MEDEFKLKLMQKFAEDERLEQMNAQKRRMRELEHKREIEKLWQLFPENGRSCRRYRRFYPCW